MSDQGGQYLERDHYDAVVVGTGFGGAVAACRLAQAGVDVAVLERGRRWPPGSFPHRLDRPGSGWFWRHRHGLYDIGPLADMVCVRAAGWGGGSLIYANVAMRPGPEVFEQAWPQPYRRETLDPYYDLAAHMLEVTPVQPDPRTGQLPPKTRVMRQAAERLNDGAPLFFPNLAVRFADDPQHPGLNRHGVTQSPCVGCARCDIGCNYGAKNTLDLNYLAVAEHHGAAVATLTEVTHLGRHGDRYELHLHQRGDAHDADREQRRVVTANHVFLAAGALGSTEILLRSRDQYRTLPDLPATLGHGYSANGDFLAFGDGTADLLSPGTGPTITSAYGLKTPSGDRFYVEDGGYPNELALLVRGRPARTSAAPGAGHDVVLLAMGRDRSDGRVRLTRRGRLRVDWDVAANMPLYTAAQRACADVVEALGGRPSATWLWRWFRRPISVHHLGGCRMSPDPAEGVVDVDGQVHGHPGLYVLDGAILPAATGANPSHTITAVAERCIELAVRHVSGDPDWRAPEWAHVTAADVPEDHVPVGALPPGPEQPGILFRERMAGTVRTTRDGQPVSAAAALTLHIDDLAAFLTDPRHRARARGRVVVPPLTGPQGSAIGSDGALELLAETAGPRHQVMAYTLPFHDLDGRRWELRGAKHVEHRHGPDLWPATTILHLDLLDPQGQLRTGAGTMRLSPIEVAKVALSVRATRTPTATRATLTTARFLAFFAHHLAQVFLPPPPRPSLRARRRRGTHQSP